MPANRSKSRRGGLLCLLWLSCQPACAARSPDPDAAREDALPAEPDAGTLEAGAPDADGEDVPDAEDAAPHQPSFEARVLAHDFHAEGTAVGDIDQDGVLDLVAGPYWYRGPSFERGGQLHAQAPIALETVSTHFLDYLDDLNGDGALDVIAIDVGGADARWYENPGRARLGEPWPRHTLHPGVGSESPLYEDLTGDGRRELVFLYAGRFGYAQPGADPNALWTFHAISGDLSLGPFTHGLGVGDIDGDRKPDVIDAQGWWQQPEDPSAPWTRYALDFSLGEGGGAQMLVFDVDGDGDSDVVTSLRAHGYGLAWFEQRASGSEPSFSPHLILPKEAGADNVSQLHALAVGDLNGDGLLDVVTGKRFWAHPPPSDPGGTDPALLLWFELVRGAGGVRFERHLLHDDSGVGCGFVVADVTGDGRPDVFVSSKKGTSLHVQR